MEPDNLVSALGLAVGDTLKRSKRFIREATTTKVDARATDRTCQVASRTETSQKTTEKHGRLDHSLRPQRHLSKTMSLGEATVWLKSFENYLEWNESVTAKDNACSRDLLEGLFGGDVTGRRDGHKSHDSPRAGRGAGKVTEILCFSCMGSPGDH